MAAMKEGTYNSDDEDGGIDVDWESEYLTIKADYKHLEKKMLIAKKLQNKMDAKERRIEGEEREKIKIVIKDRNVNEVIEILSKDPSLLYGDILHMCAESGWLEGIETVANSFILNDDYKNKLDNKGYTPIIVASQYGQLKVVEYLISKGANIKANIKAKNNDGATLVRGYYISSKLFYSRQIPDLSG